MNITYSIEGGVAYFPGLARPKSFNTSDLPDETAQQLQNLIKSIDFFRLPAQIGTPSRSSADLQKITLTVEEGKNSHTIVISEPTENTQLRELLKLVQACYSTAKNHVKK